MSAQSETQFCAAWPLLDEQAATHCVWAALQEDVVARWKNERDGGCGVLGEIAAGSDDDSRWKGDAGSNARRSIVVKAEL